MLPILISSLALAISGVTAWLTFFRRGTLKMTQPTTIFFGPDGKGFESAKSKVYLRTLLYSTAKRGQVVESLHVSLSRNETKQNFNVWVYGEKDDLKRGSGLYVPQEGVTHDHHFLLPEDVGTFPFTAGTYRLAVLAKLVGASHSTELMAVTLTVSDTHGYALNKPRRGINFDWGPDSQTYHPHIAEKAERVPMPESVARLLAETQRK